jgi:hypothetical protein
MLSTRDIREAPLGDRPRVVLDEAGIWRYADSGIAAVGARHVSLGEAVRPRLVGRQGESPEAVLLCLSEIVGDSRLNWALQAGTRLEGGHESEFLVPWAKWQEYAAEPVEAWLPEHDATGIDRCLASTERRVRLAKKGLDDAGRDRTWAILVATRVGRSRREVGEMLGLSTARVQQLNDDPPRELAEEVERFTRDAMKVVGAVGSDGRSRDDLQAPRGLGADRFEEVLEEMLALGLLDRSTDLVRVTDDGRSLSAGLGRSALSRTAGEPGAGRERDGDADR